MLPEDERGLANGFMFAGRVDRAGDRRLGRALPDAPWCRSARPTSSSIGAILLVTLFVVLPLNEPAGPRRGRHRPGRLADVGRELATFVRDAWRAFTGSRAALVGVIVALLPIGAYALSLALQSNLAVELGLDDNQVAQLNLVSTVIFALACIAGGWLSDRYGRRRMLALFIFLTVIPTLWLAWTMQQARWIMPIDAERTEPPAAVGRARVHVLGAP